MRLPALAGALLYLSATLFRVRRIAGRTWLGLVAYLALILHPLIMDFYAAARGYSLQLGFLVLGLLWADMLLALALSVASNMSVAFVAVSISILWFGMWVVRAWRLHGRGAALWHGLAGFVAYAVSAAELAAWLGMRFRAARIVGLVVLGLVAVVYLTQLRATWFAVWHRDAGVYRMMKPVRAYFREHPKRKVMVGASWEFEPPVNFYRMVWKMEHMEPVNRREYFLKDRYFMAPWDFTILAPRQRHLVDALGLKPRVEDSVSGSVLAVRPGVSR